MKSKSDFITVKIRVRSDQKDRFLGTFYLLKSLIAEDGTIPGMEDVDEAEQEYLRFLKKLADMVHIPSLDGPHKFETWQMPTVPECVGIGQCIEDKFSGDTDAPDGFVPPTVWDTKIEEHEEALYDKIKVFFNAARPSIAIGLNPNRKEELIRFVLHYAQEMKIQKFEADQYFKGAKNMIGVELPRTNATDVGFDSTLAAVFESVFLPNNLQLRAMFAQIFEFRHGEYIVPEHSEIKEGAISKIQKKAQDRIIAWLYEQSVFMFPDLMGKSPNARTNQRDDKNILELVGYICSLLGLLLDNESFDKAIDSMSWWEYLANHIKSGVERVGSRRYSNLPPRLDEDSFLA